MDEETYQKALDVIERARKDPTADRTKLRALVDAVKEHQASPKLATTQERPSVLAPEIGGPQGIDMLESKLGTPEANDAQAQAESAGMALPRGARTAAGPEDIAKNEAAAKARLDEVYDPSLPSASGIKALHRPPEFYPPQSTNPGMLDIVAGGRMMMPTYAGGGTQHFAEPTVEQFRRDMGPVIGARIASMDTSSAEYKQYADLLWKRVYDQAKAAGKPVVRHEYAPRGSAAERIAYHVGDAVDALGGAVNGFARGASFGGANAVAGKLGGDQTALDLASAEERSPIASAVGGFAGGMANPVLRGLGWLGEMGMGPSTSVAGSALRSSVNGAVGSAAAAGGEDAVDAAASGQPLDAERTKDRMIDSAKVGGLMGPAFDLLGQGAGALSTGLRRNKSLGQSVRAVEEAGGSIGGLRGVRPSPEMKGALDAAGEGGARQRVAEEIMGPAADKGFEQIAASKRAAESTNERYRAANEESFADHAPFQQELVRRRARLEGPNGPIRPDAAREYDALLGLLPQGGGTAEPKLSAAMRAEAHEPSVPNEASTGMTRREGPNDPTTVDATAVSPAPRMGTQLEPRAGGMTAEQARAAGHDPDALLKEAGIPDSIAGDFEFFLEHPESTPPKGLNARHVDLIIDRIDNLLKEGKGGKPDPEYAWLGSAARKMRDSLPDSPEILGQRNASVTDAETGQPLPLKGWGAFKANTSEEAARMNQALGLAGVEGADGIPDANRFKQARGSFANYGDPARAAENRAQEALAGAAGVSGGLKTIAGLRGREELVSRSALPLEGGGLGGRGQRAVNRARLTLDPALRNMSMNPDTNSTPYRGLKLRSGLRGGGAGQGAAQAVRQGNVNFVGPDGNGRDISDDEAGRIKSSVDYHRLMGLF